MSAAARVSYHDVKAQVLENIRNNVWAPGTILPGEIELSETFGCARATVNRAMRELVSEGLIERKRKAGTMVKMAPTRHARFQIPLVREEVEEHGGTYRYALVSQRISVTPQWLKVRPGWADAKAALHVECMHYRDNSPYLFEDRWINVDAVPKVRAESFAECGPNEWLVREVPFSEIELSFSARGASDAVAAFLDTDPGSAVFTAERTTRLHNKAVTFARLTYHPGYKLEMRL